MSRWTYPTELVTVGSNSQRVRCLTARERREFSALAGKIKDGTIQPAQLPEFVVQWGSVDPMCSMEEVQEMPADLFDACRDAIMRLTGLTANEDEKKDMPSASAPASSVAAE